MLNLDYICMVYAQQFPRNKDTENNARKALGVLKEDGVYAMFLWLEDKDKGKKIRENLTSLLNESEIKKHLLNNSDKLPGDFKSFCEALKDIVQDIDKLFFMKKLLERTLTYALYHAKIGE